ncbi:MAG TPA: formyltransferase [Thermoanaerobaculia bacterium]
MTSAVVFAYHTVGVRCLSVLLAQGVDVKLVLTHEDNPGENVWFGSVRNRALEHGVPTVAPADPNAADVLARVRACDPDFLFSFYYRQILNAPLLAAARRGAYNVHGSLLPKYRGRVPVNWAIINGETETGATLHAMSEKPDGGDIVDQIAVPILPDDTAREVFEKVAVAAEMTLHRSLPALVAGTAKLTPQDLSKGSYFGGRRPEDGAIDWTRSAREIHNLVRAVTRPYPGAFCDTAAGRLAVWRTLVQNESAPGPPTLMVENGGLVARCGDGGLLKVLDAELDGRRLDAETLNAKHGGTLALPEGPP